ncbi:MAG TPA: transglycosylase SLT domain-containing protein [Anaerolineaceae bacterium]|nr:transglycosylase SLT domain-containing protein [Anaerolineaceae bacterium]
MTRAQSAILPAALMGCVLIVILGVFMSSQMQIPETLLQPAIVNAERSTSADPVQPQSQETAPQVVGEAKAAVPSGNEYPRECSVSEKFPEKVMKWCSLITHYARENGLDPNLVASVMVQESGGNPEAYSKSGAVGLLQVMPRDGLAAEFMCPNGPCFSARPTIQELKDPEYNVAYGTKLLAGLLGKYGDIREALRYYGPKDVGYYYADIILTILQSYQ